MNNLLVKKAPWEIANLPKNSGVLLGFSGGADSAALLQDLVALSLRDGFPLTLAHVNHGIRGEEALRDRDFCVQIAKKYGLEICVLDADVPALAKAWGKGLEETAREVRYSYFAKLMKERKIPLLVTAHHGSDHLETVLFRLFRGASPRGLGGIAPLRRFEDGFLVRPLLEVSKEDILRYCREQNISFVTDSTNEDTTYARNRIRKDVLPVVKALFPRADQRVRELSDDLAEDDDCLSKLASDFLSANEKDGMLPIPKLQSLHPAVLRRVLAAWFEKSTKNEIENVHLAYLERLVAKNQKGISYDLPGDFTVTVCDRRLRIFPKCVEAVEKIPFTEGTVKLPNGVEITVKKDCLQGQFAKEDLRFALPDSIDSEGLYFRAPTAGDKVLSGGMHVRICQRMRENKIPEEVRRGIPLLCDREGILWAPFAAIRDGVELGDCGYIVTLKLPTAWLPDLNE